MSVTSNPETDFLSEVPEQGMDDHLASLRYAGMIQNALMPDPRFLRGYLREFFILFLPRDIVSGDFYYAFCNRQRMCLAAGDCTGHGVPGALMSILGISLLNEILQANPNLNANRILNLMREKVMKALHQTGYGARAKDSIDIGLCVLDCYSGKMQFSGANRPLIMVRDGVQTEFKPDKMTIGVAPIKEIPFTNTIIETRPGDSFYLFSDGFSDQFGEVTNKKFKHKQFRGLIDDFRNMPMVNQKESFDKAFKDWKGNTRQVDDVLVFGFKL
jgi:serine phosphatase RsbU (regulator of sigma subunit)